MKLTNGRDTIARVYLEPIIGRLSDKAYGAVVESFCVKRCGRRPDSTGLCPGAKQAYEQLFRILMDGESELN